MDRRDLSVMLSTTENRKRKKLREWIFPFVQKFPKEYKINNILKTVQVKILLPLCQLHTHTACLRIQNGVLSSFTNRKYGSALLECFDTPNFFLILRYMKKPHSQLIIYFQQQTVHSVHASQLNSRINAPLRKCCR